MADVPHAGSWLMFLGLLLNKSINALPSHPSTGSRRPHGSPPRAASTIHPAPRHGGKCPQASSSLGEGDRSQAASVNLVKPGELGLESHTLGTPKGGWGFGFHQSTQAMMGWCDTIEISKMRIITMTY